MGDEARFSEKWDFRRKENNFDDSSGDDPDSNSTHNPNLLLVSNQVDNRTEAVSREQPVKARKRRIKKDESKPEKVKQVRRRKPKTVPGEDKEKKKEEMVMDGVGIFMEALLDDLKASRQGLMDWMKTELYAPDQNVASLKKRAVAAQRSVKRKKKAAEEGQVENEKQSKPDKNGPEMNKAKEKCAAQNVQELDCDAEPLDRFLTSGQGGLGRNYFQQQQQGQDALLEIESSKNETMKNQKSIVLAIEAQNLSQRPNKTSQGNTNKKRSRTGSESQKDHNPVTPFAPNLSPSLQCFPVASSQGTTSLASNNNFQVQPPVVSQIPHLSEFQTEFTGGQGFGNSLFHNNGYFSGFPAAFQPGGFTFPAQVNPATSSQQRDDNNMFGGLRVAGGAIRFSGNIFPQAEVGNSNIGLSDYRTG